MRLFLFSAAIMAGLAGVSAQAAPMQFFDCAQAPASRAFGNNGVSLQHYIYTVDNQDNLTITDPANKKQTVKIIGGGRTDNDGAPGMKWITKTHEYVLRWEDSVKEFAFSAIPRNNAELEVGMCILREENSSQ